MNIEYDVCQTCEGKGGEIEYDSDGDGAWATTVVNFFPCDDCLLNALCPGCSRAIPANEAEKAAEATVDWTCGACGWKYDETRFYSDEDDYL